MALSESTKQIESDGVHRIISGDKMQFTPPCCEPGGAFKGTVTVRLPGFAEHFSLLDEMGIEVSEAGEAVVQKNQLKVFARIAQRLPDFVVAVDVEHIESKVVAKQLSDAWTDRTFDPLLSELTGLLLNGFKVSKK